MAAESSVKTRIFVLSDTHDGRLSDQFSASGGFRPPFPPADLVLHTGDLSMVGRMEEYEVSMQLLESLVAPIKLVIAGNHDLSMHEDYFLNNPKAQEWTSRWSRDGQHDPSTVEQARRLWTSERAQRAGIKYLEEGLHEVKLHNGAHLTVYASPWQPEFFDWAFNYPHNEDRWNPPELVTGKNVTPAPKERDPHPIPKNAEVDIMMTHGPPYKHLDMCRNGTQAGCPHLIKALDRVRPRLHCFGHIHEAWGAERVSWGVGGPGQLGESTLIVGGTINGNMGVTAATKGVILPTDDLVKAKHAAYTDVSSASGVPLRHKEETLLINSCVVDLSYNASNAGWVVDMDLPKKE